MKTIVPFSILLQRIVALLFLTFTTLGFSYADCMYDQPLKAEEFAVGVMLSWKTSSENDNLLFEIEKSTDGKDFVRIGSVSGSGNSLNIIPYRFLDVVSKEAKNLYRLRQVDKNGNANLSAPTVLNRKINNALSVIQLNPESIRNTFNCTVDANKDFLLKTTVKNAMGEIISENSKQLGAGLNHLSVDLNQLPEGPYKIVFKTGSEEKIFMVWRKAQEPDVERNIALVKNN